MLPKYHFIYGIIFTILLLFFFPQIPPIGGVLILLSTVLIDFDHYLVYVFRKKNLSLKKAFRYFNNMRENYGLTRRNDVKSPIMLLHLGEVQLLVIFLAFISPYFLYISLGLLFHLFLDGIDMFRLGVLNQRDYFFVQRVFRRDKEKFRYL